MIAEALKVFTQYYNQNNQTKLVFSNMYETGLIFAQIQIYCIYLFQFIL